MRLGGEAPNMAFGADSPPSSLCSPLNARPFGAAVANKLVLGYRQLDLERRAMARHRKALGLSAEQARQALTVLVQEGKLAASEVRRALQRRNRLVRALKASLAALESGAISVRRRINGSSPMARTARTAKRKVASRKRRISAATRKMYRQQGGYMAAVRRLPKAARAKVKVIREKSGVRAAVAAAKKIAT